MPFVFDQIFAVDEANPQNVARNASVLLYQVGDATKTPVTITTPAGEPLPNPVIVNANGFGPIPMHETLDSLAWEGGGHSGVMRSYEGMKNEAIEAKNAANTAAANAAAAAEAELEARIAAGEFKGDPGTPGATGPQGPVGMADDASVAAQINNGGSSTRAALNAAYAPRWRASTTYAAGDIIVTPTGDLASARVGFTSGGSYNAADWKLSDSYSPIEVPEPVLLQRARAAKGGVVGIGDKGAIAIRFDDWHAAFKANVYPLMTARGLPAGYATISRLAEQSWTAGVTTTDIVAWNRNGIEFHSHGTDHKDPSPQGDAGIVDQIVNSKAEIEAWGVKCQGWMMPGATPLTGEVPYGTNLASTDDFYKTRTGRLLRQTYALTFADTIGSQRPIPFGMYHGLAHVTVSDGMTLADAKTWIDTAANYKVGVQIMVHAGNLGGSGMSVADFTALLDYIVTKRDAGLVEVLTPSGLAFADKSTQRLDLIRDGSFEGMTTGVNGAWTAAWTAGKTIETSGGRTGTKFLRLSNTETGLVTQRPSGLGVMGLGGETFIFEGWCKSNGAGTTTTRVLLADYNDATRLNLDLRKTGIPTTWTKVVHAFSVAPQTTVLSLSVGRLSGDGIDWDDVSIKKV